MSPSRTHDRLKRAIDIAGAATLLIATVPILGVASLLILVTMGRPVFYRQSRTGLRGRIFTLLKLRTMRATDAPGATSASDDARLTFVGRWLRSLSLDELPQLWNVLRGEMSLVGPRPLLPEYLGRYSQAQARRHEVTPGITGLAQVRGRNILSWDEKFALDVWYTDHRSLRLDVWILGRTLIAVIGGRGVSAQGHATMPEFMGDSHRIAPRGTCATS